MEENSFQGHCVLGFLSRFVETSANMADSRPARGRPRRPEGIKRLKLRESTYNLWIERKEALGLHGITNNDFAEMLLHQQLIRERDRSPHAHPDGRQPVREAQNKQYSSGLFVSNLVCSALASPLTTASSVSPVN